MGWRTGVKGQPLAGLPLLSLTCFFLLAVSHTYPFCQEGDGQPDAENGAPVEAELFKKGWGVLGVGISLCKTWA